MAGLEGFTSAQVHVQAPTPSGGGAAQESLGLQVLVNDRIAPVNLEPFAIPVLRWRLTGPSSYQIEPKAYRIFVSDRPMGDSLPAAACDSQAPMPGLVWDSGLQAGDAFAGVPLAQLPMAVSCRYWAQVVLYDHQGSLLVNSQPTTFGTGAGRRWQAAQAIWAPDDGVASDWACLRGVIDLPNRPIRWATLNATASSTKPARQFVYRLWLNGSFLGYGPVFPLGAENRYEGYDVTPYLHPGQRNALGAIAYTQEDHRFAAQLDICFEDGELAHYGSDASWKALGQGQSFPASGSIGTQYYQAPAENIRAHGRAFLCSQADLDDSSWAQVQERPAFTRLEATPLDPPQLVHRTASSIRWQGETRAILDFGQAWMGGLSLQTALETPLDLDIRYGEVLQEDGQVKFQLNTSNTYRESWRLQAGENRLETWGIRVFRYVELSCPEGSSQAAAALQQVVEAARAAVAQTSSTTSDVAFTCSDHRMERIWQLSRNTIRNLTADMYVDSWTRERAPYEADAYIQQRAHLALDDAPATGRYSLDFLAANRTWPTEWPLYTILAVHDSWLQSGSLAQVRASYQRLCALLPESYVDPDSGLVVKDPGQSSRRDGDLVDWPEVERDGYVFGRVNTVVNSLASQAYTDMANMARALGHDGDAALFASRAGKMRASIHRYLYDADQGAYFDGLDTGPKGRVIDHHAVHASIFALTFAQVPVSRIPALGKYLRSRGMACSVYTAAVYLAGLYQAGLGADAFQLLDAAKGTHTWQHMLDQGAGATMEAWDPAIKPNTTYSHPWAASPAYLLPSGLMGLNPLEPGWRRFSLIPQLGDLLEARMVLPTRAGDIDVSCRLSGPEQTSAGRTAVPGMDLELKVPARQQAEVVLPPVIGSNPGQLVSLEVDGHRQEVLSASEPFTLAGTLCWPGSTRLNPLGPGIHSIRLN
ncbi:hypothetical protein KIM372_02980 [Bombiscardovia nodaiensis]|uniref:alpha-L-rhamnosidase n=1 Tax=Bombiscardovia nodaiensis TaxID=2932181 RepID=A0ABN6S851_9BIFI|nr:hypothetical protein KIM372_02980 [Bombiscardovia nodaiensis]